MAKLHRKELKQDEVRETIADALKGLKVHGRELIYAVTIVIAVAFITLAWWYYERRQQEQSQLMLGTALEKMQAPVGEQPPEKQPGAQPAHQYKNEEEKYRDALKDLEAIINKYGNTSAAESARYQAGVAAFYLKDYSKAEQFLKQSTRVSDKKLGYYLSRMTLADFYLKTGKPGQAIPLLKEAVEKNREGKQVPQESLLMKLGEAYEKAGKTGDAVKTYQQISQDFEQSPAKYKADKKLEELKAK
jgi:tetratricopeptide (TPR) repeat protein